MSRTVEKRREELVHLPDSELSDLCVEGEELAWEALVHRYRKLVYAIPHRAGLTLDQAEDVFHATFAKLAENLAGIHDRSRVRAWIVTTARRLTIDTIRRRQASPLLDDSEPVLEHVADGGEPPGASLERLEKQHVVRQALQHLGDRCRQLLLLLFFHADDQPPSYETISRETGMRIGSIGPTRARCLEELAKRVRRIEKEG